MSKYLKETRLFSPQKLAHLFMIPHIIPYSPIPSHLHHHHHVYYIFINFSHLPNHLIFFFKARSRKIIPFIINFFFCLLFILLYGLRHFVHLATNRRWNKKKEKQREKISSFRFFSAWDEFLMKHFLCLFRNLFKWIFTCKMRWGRLTRCIRMFLGN